MTWNNAPGYSYNPDPSADALGPGSFVEWDVTNSVDDWVRGILTNYGFRLAGDRATQCIVGFQSWEYGISDPQLEIVYTSPSSTLCMKTGMRRIEASEMRSAPIWP